MPRWWPAVRDLILFVGGLLGVIHETLLVPVGEPQLIILFGAMMGLPAFLRADERNGK